MRRIASSVLLVASCLAMNVLDARPSWAAEPGASAFRALTSESSSRPPIDALAQADVGQTSPDIGPIAGPALSPTQPSVAPQTVAAPSTTTSTAALSHAPRLVNFYGGPPARVALAQLPRRAAIQPQPQRTARRQPKPFESIEHEPTISPYIILDEDESNSQNVPNYFTWVRPRLEQREVNRAQQQELQRLRGQLQSMTANPVGGMAVGAGGSAGVKSSARFMDTGQFYGGMR